MSKMGLGVFATLFGLFGFLAAMPVFSATFYGAVMDSESNHPLAEVKVMAQPSGEATTDAGGRFQISGLEPGNVKFTFAYLGYETLVREVPFDGQGQDPVFFRLAPGFLRLPGIKVTAQRQGQAKALNQQKNADHIQNIIASDLMGRFPDQNTAEALQRIPGVMVDRDQGEGRYVMIRGTEPRLTSVKINGQEIPSPEGNIRFVALDIIAADQLSAIEVNKSLTPEMDGDAIGGSVNLITLSAQDTSASLRASLAGGYNAEMESAKQFQGMMGYAQRFLRNGALGFNLSGSYSVTHRGSDNNEMSWGEEDVQGEDEFTLQTLELRDYEVTRDRLSLSGALDFRFNPSSQIHLQGIYSRFADQEYRRRLTYHLDDGEYQSALISQDASVERELKDRYEAQDILSVTAGGKHGLAGLNLDYSVSLSHAQEKEPDALYSVFEQGGIDMTIQGSSLPRDFPKIEVTNDADIQDAAAYEFSEFVFDDNKTTDQNFILSLNLEKPFAPGNLLTSIKAGGKARFKEKERKNSSTAYEWDADGDAPTLESMVGSFVDEDFLGGRYTVGRSPDPDRSRNYFDANRASLSNDEDDYLAENAPGNYQAKENILAGYAQARGQWGQFMALAGARYEHTSLDYSGNSVLIEEEGVTVIPVSQALDYGHVLPMLHLRYAVTPGTQIRAAFTYSLARPNYYDLVPYEIQEDDEISKGNPDLKATVSANADLMAEHYFQNLGILSAGFFYKFMDNPIYMATFEEGDLTVEQPRNSSFGEIYGLEAAWVQQFTFLPGFLNGLGIYANYTFAWSETLIPGREGFMDLPGQSAHVGNAALTYEKHGFSGRLAMNYHGQWLRAAGPSEDEDEWADDRLGLDLSLSQEVHPGLRVFAEALNLTDAPLRTYQGQENRPIQQEYYSYWMNLGVKYQF